ncbi:helix-turn-helix domain-containing protein [Chromobacterium violaceum]|uniref:helix-turn-helix transcriptional regulator n=1 Tax=Chromobacterium violaceum TaxID=536 RepID=UPI001C8C9701|nr:helix-turn-helix domain-containing protein [Chromobacterium violaceum]
MADLVSIKTIAERTQLSSSYIRKMVKNGKFPKPLRIGNSTRWPVKEVDRWIECVTTGVEWTNAA